MATIFDTFQQSVVGSEGRIYDYVPLLSSNGDFGRISDLQVILNSWTNLLMTPLRSYNNDPEYGSELYKMVFEPADQQTISKIQREVTYRLMRYDNRATIQDVQVQFTKKTKEVTLNITVKYENQTGTLHTTINSRDYLNIL